MLLDHLNDGEREVVRRALEGSLRFLFEPYGEVEYSLRMGLDSAVVRAMVARLAETGDLADDYVGRRAVNNSFNELLNGLGISEAECLTALGVARAEALRIYRTLSRSVG
ncbi:MAG: hypothetical protein NTY35_05500 [Planctomycetota bacterium]|nr:hypothetical protein [Planctomycetota bacterium]